MSDTPKIAVWVTAGNRPYVRWCLPSFTQQCTYAPYELLISHHRDKGPDGTWPFLQAYPYEPKRLFDTSDTDFSGAYYRLLDNSPEYYINLSDDFLFLCDPAEMIRDAIRLMESRPDICMVRLCAHTPMFLDTLNSRFWIQESVVGPIIYGFGLGDTQNVVRCATVRNVPEVWQVGKPYREVNMREPLGRAGYTAAFMLRYWGASVHVGTRGEDGTVTAENAETQKEALLIQRWGLYGVRPRRMLYSGALTEEQKRVLVYPLFVTVANPLVPNHVPYEAQARTGVPVAVRVR